MENTTNPSQVQTSWWHRHWLLGLLALYVVVSLVLSAWIGFQAGVRATLWFVFTSNIAVLIAGLIGGLVVGRRRRHIGMMVGVALMTYLGWAGMGVLPMPV